MISEKLRMVRECFNLTLQEVGKKTGIGLSSLSEFENGKRDPSISQLKKLSALYDKPITYFLEPSPVREPSLLWRQKPGEDMGKKISAKFMKLCEQYKNLEIWTKAKQASDFGKLFASSFPKNHHEVKTLAQDASKLLDLGARPGEGLFRILEEVYGVKIFYLPLGDITSSACFYSDALGPAVMLNSNSKQWRRNFDLSHELFHLITWNVRPDEADKCVPMRKEESFANYFAGIILMPEEAVKSAVESAVTDDTITVDNLDAIARQFAVSLDALACRLKQIYPHISSAGIDNLTERAKNNSALSSRKNETPPRLPARYVALAETALKRGEISSQQFANYLSINIPDISNYRGFGNADVIQINTGNL